MTTNDDRIQHFPLRVNREYNADGTAAECKGRSSTEIATATGIPLGIWVDYEWDGICPRATMFAAATTVVNQFARLISAADDLLSNARDNGECFIDQDDDRYDSDNPEQMYPDWAELHAETEKAKALLNTLEPTEK